MLPFEKNKKEKDKGIKIINDFQKNSVNVKRPAKSSLVSSKNPMKVGHISNKNSINNQYKDPYRPNTRGEGRCYDMKYASPYAKEVYEKLMKKRNNTAKTFSTRGKIFNINKNIYTKNKRVKTSQKSINRMGFYDNTFNAYPGGNMKRSMLNKFTNGFSGKWNMNSTQNKYNNIFNVYNNFNMGGKSSNAYLYNLNYIKKSQGKSPNKSYTQRKNDKLPEISKKELKQKLNQLNKNKNEEDIENIPKEIEDQFYTNKKNFFQIRKDIPEEDENELNESEEESKENKIKNGKRGSKIAFPLIFKYFNEEN